MPIKAPTQTPMIKASNPITNREISASVSFTDIDSVVGVAANALTVVGGTAYIWT